ncbi:MAG: hypothetical protein R3B40_08845 [Polyangiales bacterium]|nr:hypothetical protein [Myxococcales bacterium]MCB9656286.1 hypothetical protein [Sandaracinaceae bacterium]
MEIPPDTLVRLTLDPADHVLLLDHGATTTCPFASGALVRRTDERVVLRFAEGLVTRPDDPRTAEANSVGSGERHAHVSFTMVDDALSVPDALFLLSVLWLTDYHADAFLHESRSFEFVDARSGQAIALPHPPRIETSQALLAALPLAARLRALLAACELAVPVWSAWARTGDLTYYDGIMSMASVPARLAESTLAAVARWLEDGIPEPLAEQLSAYRSLHWPMLEDNWSVPPNVYYSLFAPRNLADCALEGGDLDAARVCLQQATAARATNALDEFLGEPFRKAFLLGWWRACVHILRGAPVPVLELASPRNGSHPASGKSP